MRLIAVPLARARPGLPPVSTFLAQRAPATPSFVAQRPALAGSPGEHDTGEASASSSSSSDATVKAPPPADDAGAPGKGGKLPLTSRIMNKAADFWVGLGREDQKSILDWKRRTYVTGERLMDRIEYEEWALKGVDPALGPSLSPRENGVRRKEEAEAEGQKEAGLAASPSKSVALLYPPSLLSPTALLTSLTKMTASRQPHHRQRLIWCVVGMPFTIPFALIPIIPNLPFFYLAWRAWSHWRAYQSSKYLRELLQKRMIVPCASPEVDQIFSIPAPATSTSEKEVSRAEAAGAAVSAAAAPPAKSPSTQVNGQKPETASGEEAADGPKSDYESLMILKPCHIKALADEFKMDRQLSVDLARARQQTIKSIQAGELAKLDAAAELGSSTSAAPGQEGPNSNTRQR